jgi:hypothetical protein
MNCKLLYSEGSDHGVIEAVIPRETEVSHGNPARKEGVQAGIRTEHLTKYKPTALPMYHPALSNQFPFIRS